MQFEIRLYLHIDTFIYNSKSDFVFSHCVVEIDCIHTKNLDSPFLVPILFNDTMDLRHEEVLIKFFTTFLQT